MITRDTMPATRPVSVAVIGCGVIGASWAALFQAYGHYVTAWDPIQSAREQFLAATAGIRAQLTPLLPEQAGPDGEVVVVTSLGEAVRHVHLVQENAPENASLKCELYQEIEASCGPTTTIASSTSSLVHSELSAGMARPERLITAHPFNPPHLMPLVEIYGIDTTVVAAAEAFYRRLERVPVVLRKEAVGHIANRLSSALWREAVNIVAEGIADVPAVDTALVNGPGLRWSVIGAHMAYHLGGGPQGIEGYLKHLGPSQERRWSTLGTPSLTPDVCRLLVDGIADEAGGRDIETLRKERDQALLNRLRQGGGASVPAAQTPSRRQKANQQRHD